MDISDLQKIKQNFISELNASNSGKNSSLAFIKHTLPSSCLVKENEYFQVMVIGGSISKKAMIKKKDKNLVISQISQKNQSPFKTGSSFLSFIEQELDDNITTLSLNLAYPLNPIFKNGKLEGILISGTKENTFYGLIGKNICAEVEDYILKKKKRKIKVTCANDTICLLLSGLSQLSWDKIACGIVGTGTNFAIFLNKNTLVNLESANFDKFTQSQEGKEIDKNSSLPKRAIFEKETAGAYLYKHFNLKIQKKHLPIITIDDTKELSILSQETSSSCRQTAKDLLCYSSELVATQIAGIAQFLNKDITFIMEGSLFWEGYEYKKHLEQTLIKIYAGKQISFRHIHNSYLIGAAQLACPQI